MADRPIVDDGVGFIGQEPIVSVNKENVVSLVRDLQAQLKILVLAVNGRLSLGSGISGRRAGNLDAQTLDILTPTAANTEMIIPHGLGRLPQFVYPVLKDKACDIYASSLGSWGSSDFRLKATVGDATIKLLVA